MKLTLIVPVTFLSIGNELLKTLFDATGYKA